MKYFLLLFVMLLPACTGSAYELPTIHPEEVVQVEDKLRSDSKNLRSYDRSDSHYKNRIRKISNRLQNNAEPLCEYAEYSPCKFEVSYSGKNVLARQYLVY